jgi:hypothetical protein
LDGISPTPNSARIRPPPGAWLRKAYRLWRPIPKSPSPQSANETHDLQLIPREAFAERVTWAIQFLAEALGSGLGDYVEFGVYNGTSMICTLEALRRAGQPPMQLFGFDSFQGLPPSVAEEDGGVWHPGQFYCPRHIAEDRIASATNNDRRIHVIEGWYTDVLTTGDTYGVERASLVMIDSDTYSSAKLALAFAGPLLTDPCVLIFDDWRLNDLDVLGMGEYRAFYEWVSQYPHVRCRGLSSYSRKSKMVILQRHQRLG